MQEPSEEEIAAFFDQLNPADFITEPSTAIARGEEDFPHHGPDLFEQFMLRYLSETDRDEAAHFAVLHSGDAWRRYEMNDENLPEFMLRVAIEGKKMHAKWMFMAVPGEASMGGMFDPNDPDDIQRVRDAGLLIDVTNWYAESTEPMNEDIRFGIVMDNEKGERQIIQSTNVDGVNPAFRRVLHIEG